MLYAVAYVKFCKKVPWVMPGKGQPTSSRQAVCEHSQTSSCNGRSMVLPEGAATLVSAAQRLDDMSRVNRPLVEAIAKAHRWQAQLEFGEYASLEDLAKDVGCDRTYVGRILHLTSLAPDIIEAILRGEEPDGMSLEKLRKNLPVRWEEQRNSWR